MTKNQIEGLIENIFVALEVKFMNGKFTESEYKSKLIKLLEFGEKKWAQSEAP